MLTSRLEQVDKLRTIAAILVALYHFLLFNEEVPLFASFNIHQPFFTILGKAVLTFFIVTGVVIPYQCEQQDYTLKDYWRFMLKRFLRVHIPFMAVIVFIIATTALHHKHAGKVYQFDWGQLISNLTYTAAFTGKPWYNTIFWTLAIEMQFYLMIGIIYPFIRKYNLTGIALVFIAGELLQFFIPSNHFVWAYTPYFIIGFLLYRYYKKELGAGFILGSSLILGGVIFWLHDYSALPVFFLVIAGALLFSGRSDLLSGTGKYTFSFYLFHGLSGGMFLYFMRHFGNGDVLISILKIAGAFAVAFPASYLFYLVVEKPATRLTHRIQYRRR